MNASEHGIVLADQLESNVGTRCQWLPRHIAEQIESMLRSGHPTHGDIAGITNRHGCKACAVWQATCGIEADELEPAAETMFDEVLACSDHLGHMLSKDYSWTIIRLYESPPLSELVTVEITQNQVGCSRVGFGVPLLFAAPPVPNSTGHLRAL